MLRYISEKFFNLFNYRCEIVLDIYYVYVIIVTAGNFENKLYFIQLYILFVRSSIIKRKTDVKKKKFSTTPESFRY